VIYKNQQQNIIIKYSSKVYFMLAWNVKNILKQKRNMKNIFEIAYDILFERQERSRNSHDFFKKENKKNTYSH